MKCVQSMRALCGSALTLVLWSTTSFWSAAARADDVVVTNRPAVGLVLLDQLMSGRSKVGDPVRYATVAPVTDSSGRVLIPAGLAAYGSATHSRGSGMFGKRGELDFTCDYVAMPDGSHVPLTGSNVSRAGANDLPATAAVTVLVSPVGLLIKGGTVKIPSGTPVTMYIADGARIAPPASAAANGLRARFNMRNKKQGTVEGTAVGFDGTVYTVQSAGGTQRLAAEDIKSIELDFTPPQLESGADYRPAPPNTALKSNTSAGANTSPSSPAPAIPPATAGSN